MKCFITVLMFLLFCSVSLADYSIDWYTIDGGGGTSTGGQYKLSGTIGQPDAAFSQGAQYEVLGGYWPGGPLCFVEFDDYASFAQWWLYTGSDLPADLSLVNDVVFEDLLMFTDQWLYGCAPDWPLR